jgi:hypothetical protein
MRKRLRPRYSETATGLSGSFRLIDKPSALLESVWAGAGLAYFKICIFQHQSGLRPDVASARIYLDTACAAGYCEFRAINLWSQFSDTPTNPQVKDHTSSSASSELWVPVVSLSVSLLTKKPWVCVAGPRSRNPSSFLSEGAWRNALAWLKVVQNSRSSTGLNGGKVTQFLAQSR